MGAFVCSAFKSVRGAALLLVRSSALAALLNLPAAIPLAVVQAPSIARTTANPGRSPPLPSPSFVPRRSSARVRASGRVGGAEAKGPAYFKVWTKSGQVHTYDASSNAEAIIDALVAVRGSTVAMVWAILHRQHRGPLHHFESIWPREAAVRRRTRRSGANADSIRWPWNAGAQEQTFDYADRANKVRIFR